VNSESDDLSIGTFDIESVPRLCHLTKSLSKEKKKLKNETSTRGTPNCSTQPENEGNNKHLECLLPDPLTGKKDGNDSIPEGCCNEKQNHVAHNFEMNTYAEEQLLAENRSISEQLRPHLLRSALSQEALHQWDKQQGLPASHARTMLRSKRTRDQLLEG
jgi:hypothetical protein